MVEETNTLAKFNVAGVRWSSVAAQIKNSTNANAQPLDLALLELAAGSTVSAVFTQNAFCAAPVLLAKSRLADIHKQQNQSAIYCLINAGNANAGTGDAGLLAAQQSCEMVAKQLDCDVEAVLPFSTGVIGEPLPVVKFTAAASALVKGLSSDGWSAASQAIMTTDTVPKIHTEVFDIDGKKITLSGIAKGAGMIKPNMATMLSYIATDATIEQGDLDDLLATAVKQSFNRITVDGDTSTNDVCLLAATGASGLLLTAQHAGWNVFEAALCRLMRSLATAIIRDAEGATKFITIDVCGGKTADECLAVGYTVAESPLVKTAFFASDANWGRILAAVGRSAVSDLKINDVAVFLNDYCICRNGCRVDDYDEKTAMAIMANNEIKITIDLGRGTVRERLWTSDLSHDYVSINADYRS